MYQQRKPTTGTLSRIPDGVQGTKQVLSTMRRLVNDGKKSVPVRLMAANIVKRLPPKDWINEARLIQRWVRDNIRYTKDIYGVETLHSAEKVLELEYGDCDDKSILVSAMLESIGHPTRFKAVGFSRNALSHVYPQVKIKGQWIPVETTETGWELGREPPNIKNKIYR